MNISVNDKYVEVDESTLDKVNYFDIETTTVKCVDGDTFFWCPFKWDWRLIDDKDTIEKKYNGCMKVVYYHDTIFLVLKKNIKKYFVNNDLRDVCELPIGIMVYWNEQIKQWDFLAYT